MRSTEEIKVKEPPKVVPKKKEEKNVMDDIDALIMEEDEGHSPDGRRNDDNDGDDFDDI